MQELLAAILAPDQIQHWMEAGGYLVLFGLLFSCGLGVPLPEDIPLVLAGFMVGQGRMHLLPAAIAAWCGIIGGDCVLYYWGHKYGRNITRLPLIGKHVTPTRIERAEHLFARYGIWVVAVGRLFAGIRAAMVVAAGTSRFHFIKFIIADGLAALVSGGLFIALGHWCGRQLGDRQQLQHRIDVYKHWLLLAAAVLAVLATLYILWRRKRHHAIVDVLIEKASGQGPKPS